MKRTVIFLFLLQAFTLTAREAAQPKPLSFIENKGQIIDQHGKHRSDIDFKAEAGGMVMFVGDAQLHYQWYRDTSPKPSPKPARLNCSDGERALNEEHVTSPSERTGEVSIYRLDVELIGANKNAELVTEDKQEYTENYYLPQCPDGATAHSFGRVIYKNVYPNIDWVIYTNSKFKIQNSKEGTIIDQKSSISNELKYDFIVHPGGDYRDIQIRYNGATKIELKDGALVATTPFGSISENAPYTYDADTKKEITSKFILNGNILTYGVIQTSDSKTDMVIDPGLRWATYFGGSNSEFSRHSAVDSTAKVYLCGSTVSISNIATTGAHQTTFGGTTDAFVVKFDTAGVRLWCTYYGGTDYDIFNTVTTDIQGNIILGGHTSSASGIASAGAFKTSLSTSVTSSDAMLVKLDSNGLRQWGTYFGGGDDDDIYAVSCDMAGNIFMGGVSNNTGLATSGAFQTTGSGGYMAKFSASGNRLWCTYYNGDIYALQTDLYGRVYIGGKTTVSTGVATAGAFLTTCPNCPSNNGFLASFDTSGSRNWGTYYGGFTQVYSIACDPIGNVYFSGYTGATTGIATTGTHQPSLSSTVNSDGFLVKFTSNGSRVWGTYYGGTDLDDIKSLAISESGDIFAMGATLSSTGISSSNGYQISYGGGNTTGGDAFLVQFNPYGVRKWATYYGGNSPEIDQPAHSPYEGHCSYAKNKIYIGGTTQSSSAIATSGAYQTIYGGGGTTGGDAFIAQFEVDTQVYVKQAFTDTALCAGDTLKLKYGCAQQFRSTNIFTVQLSNSSGSFTSPTVLATLNSNARFGTILCPIPVNTATGNGYRVRIIASAPADTSYDDMLDIKINPKVIPIASSNSPICSGNTLNLNAIPTTSGVVWNWSGPNSFTASTQNTNITNAQTASSGDYIVSASNNGCVRKDTVTVTINPTPIKPSAGNNSPLCIGNTLNLTATSATGGVSWNWTGPISFSSTTQNPVLPNVQTNQSGDYVVTATLGACSSRDTTTVVVNSGPTINVYVNPNDTVCAGNTVTLVALVTNGGTGPSYQWYKNSNMILGATSSSYITTPINGDVYYCKLNPGTGTSCNGTINSNSITITVLPYTTPSITITASPDTNIWQGLMVNFSATVSSCSSPSYQWKLNGNDITGATGSLWGAATLADNSRISCVLTCNDICPNPKTIESNKLRMHVSTGINNTTNALSAVNIYPNPMHDELHIEGISKGTRIRLYDVLGREVYKTVTAESTHIISTASLHTGTYILQLTDAAGNRGSYKVVKE